MKIPVSDYFSKDFHSAYLFENNQNRRVVELVKNGSTKKHPQKRFISYAKYLWISANNQEVPVGYDVDHIDGNPRNDTIDNLQILTKREKHTEILYSKSRSPTYKTYLPCLWKSIL